MRKAYSLGLYEKAMPDVSWKEKLQIAKEAGYDFVEISIDATEERISRVYSTKQERRELPSGIPIRRSAPEEWRLRSGPLTWRQIWASGS